MEVEITEYVIDMPPQATFVYAYPKAREGTSVIHKKLKIGTKTMRMSIYESQTSITIYIGGHEEYCIEIQMMKPGYGYDITMAHFSKIRWDLNCSLEYNFQRGVDTNMLLKLAMSYISRNYRDVTHMTFNDASSRTCDDGRPVDLAKMSYICTGKTWYEKHFGAYIAPLWKNAFETQHKKFNEAKKTMTWEQFNGFIGVPLPLDKQTIEKMYNDSDTWQDFFSSVRDAVGIGKFCEFVAPWLDSFLLRYLQFNFIGFNYIMPITDYDLSYSVSEYIRGGKRNTRKCRIK